MSITSELRDWVLNHYTGWLSKQAEGFAIADRIDAEHEKAMSMAGQLLADAEKDRDYNYAQWQDCKQKVLQHNITIDELDARIECLEDKLSHCIELPKDTDGEYIHIGDVLTDDAEFKSEGKVMRLMLEDEGWMVGIGCAGWIEPSIHEWHHYHAPTVEDVLCELLNEYREGGCTLEETRLSDFAAKLQLREDA